MENIAVYPGTFDPVTNGHIDVINRANKIFDKVIVLVGNNPNKKELFTTDERVDLIKNTVKDIEVTKFEGLLTNFMEKNNYQIIIRGLRAVSDFDFEFQRALLNRKQNSNMETIFIMTNESYVFLNSSIIKEMAMFNGNLDNLVPEYVKKKLEEKFQK